MPALKLPLTKDRTRVFVDVFDYSAGGTQPEKFVVPLAGATGANLAGQVTGEVTLVAGVATIPLTSIKSTSLVYLSRRTVAGTAGNLGYTRTAGVGFSITNSSATDTSIVDYLVVI